MRAHLSILRKLAGSMPTATYPVSSKVLKPHSSIYGVPERKKEKNKIKEEKVTKELEGTSRFGHLKKRRSSVSHGIWNILDRVLFLLAGVVVESQKGD